MGETREVRFSPTQRLPEGYRVVWLEMDEGYQWQFGGTLDFPDRASDATWDRFAAYRGAWRDYADRKRAARPHPEGGDRQ